MSQKRGWQTLVSISSLLCICIGVIIWAGSKSGTDSCSTDNVKLDRIMLLLVLVFWATKTIFSLMISIASFPLVLSPVPRWIVQATNSMISSDSFAGVWVSKSTSVEVRLFYAMTCPAIGIVKWKSLHYFRQQSLCRSPRHLVAIDIFYVRFDSLLLWELILASPSLRRSALWSLKLYKTALVH